MRIWYIPVEYLDRERMQGEWREFKMMEGSMRSDSKSQQNQPQIRQIKEYLGYFQFRFNQLRKEFEERGYNPNAELELEDIIQQEDYDDKTIFPMTKEYAWKQILDLQTRWEDRGYCKWNMASCKHAAEDGNNIARVNVPKNKETMFSKMKNRNIRFVDEIPDFYPDNWINNLDKGQLQPERR